MPIHHSADKTDKADPFLLAGLLNEKADKRIDILRRIADVGSISEAARGAGVSYKAAWQAIETLENLAGGDLVEKNAGGAKGGGTRLTPIGRQVLEITNELARSRAEVLARFKTATHPELCRIGSSTLRTSMRNQFPARITTMKIGSALVRLILQIDDTHLIRASVTKESAQLLGLEEGMEVLAMTKTTAVNITANLPPNNPDSPENHLIGEIIRSERAAKGGECALRLPSGIVIVGFARGHHGLKINQKAVATIPSSAVTIGLTN